MAEPKRVGTAIYSYTHKLVRLFTHVMRKLQLFLKISIQMMISNCAPARDCFNSLQQGVEGAFQSFMYLPKPAVKVFYFLPQPA